MDVTKQKRSLAVASVTVIYLRIKISTKRKKNVTVQHARAGHRIKTEDQAVGATPRTSDHDHHFGTPH